MNIFIIYIGIIRLESHFDSTNIKASIGIILINFNEIFKMAHLTMLVIFYVDVIIYQNFNLLHNYWIFWNEFFSIIHIVSKHGSYYVT